MVDLYGSSDDTSKKWLRLAIGLLTIIAAIGGFYFFFKSRQKIISPIPPAPSFEVIFYTPTPPASTPASTPSATPKGKRTPTPTPKTTKTTPTPTKGKTSTPTVSPTKKPTATPTATPKP